MSDDGANTSDGTSKQVSRGCAKPGAAVTKQRLHAQHFRALKAFLKEELKGNAIFCFGQKHAKRKAPVKHDECTVIITFIAVKTKSLSLRRVFITL